MNTKQITRIEWMSEDADMLLTLIESQGVFQYESKLIIPSTALNKLLCEIQKENGNMDVNDCLQIEQWSETQINYIFDFSTTNVQSTFWMNHMEAGEFKSIRA